LGYAYPLLPMESLSPARLVAASLLAITLAGCGPSDEADRAKAGPIVGPFVVSQFFTPSGLMGDGAVPGRLTVDINKNCKVPRPPGAQGDCYRFLYKPSTVKWAGAFWVTPANNWGTAEGREMVGPVDMGVADPSKPGSPNLRGYTRVRLSMALEVYPAKNCDPAGTSTELPPCYPKEQIVRFWAGRLDGRQSKPPQPYYDRGCLVFPGSDPTCVDDSLKVPAPYAFAPAEESGRFAVVADDTTRLEPNWKNFTIDLSTWSVESLIGAFGFASNTDANPQFTQIIYFDDIVWE
jgi:hypothetical protein